MYYYDPGMLVCRIGEALREARKAKNIPPRLALPPKPESDTAVILASAYSGESQSTDLTVVAQPNQAALGLQRQQVERARRLHTAELPHRVTLTTRAGLVVRTVNLSNSGILFESPLKFTPETETDFTVFGERAKVDLSALIVRSEAKRERPRCDLPHGRGVHRGAER